ncbi:unnamed protein product, partial [Thlaspi arvense]
MKGDDTQKNENQLTNVYCDVSPSSENGLSKSRNLFRQKDRQNLAVFSIGKWLQIFKNSPKVSCEFSTSSSPSPSHVLSKLGANHKAEFRIRCHQSEKMHEKTLSLPSKTFSSPSIDISQGTLQFTMRANEMPRFVFKLENQKDVYVATLSRNVKDQTILDYSYMIHLQRGVSSSSSSSSSSSHLVGRIKVSTLFSRLNERITEREFVLFSSNGEYSQILPCGKKNRGLSARVNDVLENNQSASRLRCSWDQQFQEPSYQQNNLPPNLETLAIVVKEEDLEKETGGWGLKFLKKSSLVHTKSESLGSLISMDVVVPSGIHGGPEGGPLSLIERWKSQGNCDCGGWDLGCSFTLLKGQRRKDHCNLFELFKEGSNHETPVLRIVNVRGGLYSVQFQTNLSSLQTFTVALAFIHSQSSYVRCI